VNLLNAGVTFVAAGVEWVEALTIVLAVGIVRGWRSAFTGTAIAVVALAAMIAVFGLALAAYLPVVRTLIGVFLLLFGLKWLHKAILRSAGLKALHDEAKALAETEEELRSSRAHWAGVATAFNGVLLEGLEVVFIVIAVGSLNQNSYLSPVVGAVASLVAVIAVGFAARRPLTQVPENTLKFVVGIMLTSLGTFFVGEGIGVYWPGNDLIILGLVVFYILASLLAVWYLRRPAGAALSPLPALRIARAVWGEVYGLLVDDSALAVITVAAVMGVALLARRNGLLSGPLLVIGVVAAIAISLAGPARARAAAERARK
jgi:uncharacterized membrane protein